MKITCEGCYSFNKEEECGYKKYECPCMTCIVKIVCRENWWECDIFDNFENKVLAMKENKITNNGDIRKKVIL